MFRIGFGRHGIEYAEKSGTAQHRISMQSRHACLWRPCPEYVFGGPAQSMLLAAMPRASENALRAHTDAHTRKGTQTCTTASRLHVVLTLLLVELPLLLCCRILVLLVLGDKVIHVAFSLRKLHLVHALACVPMEEGLAAEHGREVLRHALEHLLDCCGIASKGHSHLQALGRDIADRGLDVVWNPLHKVGRVLILHIEHLFVHFLRGHAAPEEGSSRKVAAMAGIGSAHHVLGVKHLLRELWHSEGSVLLGAPGRERCEAGHEEVQPWERDKVDSDLAEVTVELPGEAEASGHTADGSAHQVVQITVSGRRKLQSPEADVVESLVVEQEALVGILHQLVEGEHGVVGL